MGALALTVLIPSAAFAATSGTSTNTSTPSTNQSKYGAHNWQHKPGNRSFMNADEIKTLADKYTPELSAQFQQVFDSMKTNAPHKSFPALDAATKQKLDAIHQQLKDGKITKESVEITFNKLKGICYIRSLPEDKRKEYQAIGSIKMTMKYKYKRYYDDKWAPIYINRFLKEGHTLAELKEITDNSESYRDWEDSINKYL